MSRILVGIDDSPGAREALAWAAREAQATGAALSVIHAWQFDIAWIDAVSPDVPKWRDRARDTAERLVGRVAQEVCGAQPVGRGRRRRPARRRIAWTRHVRGRAPWIGEQPRRPLCSVPGRDRPAHRARLRGPR